MKMYHCTPTVNVESILLHGLLTSYSTSNMKVVWLVDRTRLLWAKKHIADRKGVSILCVTAMLLEVPAKNRHKSSNGVYYSSNDIDCIWFYPLHMWE